MRVCSIAALILVLASPTLAAEPPALAKARALYNAGSYDEAIESAAMVRGQPEHADAAALVMARSHLERFRRSAEAADLDVARETLTGIRAAALSPRDQVDLQIGLGQTLYLAQSFGAAAEVFDTAFGHAALLEARDRALLLDWWASSLDREAATRPAERRAPVYTRIAGRMEEELRADPGSAVANYWLVAAARGEGDLDRAWDAAVAAWVRSTLSPATMDTLRRDLERFVVEALIPERARTRPAREQQDAGAMLQAEWEAMKQDWK